MERFLNNGEVCWVERGRVAESVGPQCWISWPGNGRDSSWARPVGRDVEFWTGKRGGGVLGLEKGGVTEGL
jgi:hypothetical protein